MPMIYAPKEAFWWVDYLHSASENELKASFERFKALDELPDAFDHPNLASRKQSLIDKHPLFQAWISASRLAVVTTALDPCMKFLNRKFENTQTFRGSQSGLATVNARLEKVMAGAMWEIGCIDTSFDFLASVPNVPGEFEFALCLRHLTRFCRV